MKSQIAAVVLFALSTSSALAAVDPAATKPGAVVAQSKSALPTGNGFNCFDLRKAAQKLPIYVANIENKNTTRTAEGEPYKRQDIVCREMYCESAPQSDFKLVVDRSHPDANSAGYVRFPVIDVPTQFASLTAAAAEVRLLAGTGACGATAISAQTMALIKYDSGASIQSDTFNYATDGRLTSWSRILRDGTQQSYAFGTDGAILK